MSTPFVKQSTVHQPDKSDVLSILQSIETMFEVCQNVLNTYTQVTLMLSITTEAKMLQLKLQVMKDRWSYHLPFKEACLVDFYDWSKKVDEMSRWMIGKDENGEPRESLPEYCPSKHFMLDFYTLLPENKPAAGASPYFSETNITQLIAEQEKMQKQIAQQWVDYKARFSQMVVDHLGNPVVANLLNPMPDHSLAISTTCGEVLKNLAKALYDLYEMPTDVIKKDQFVRLAERVVNESEYGGRDVQKEARREVNNLKDTTPEEDWLRRLEEEINVSGNLISDMKYGSMVLRYLSHNYNIKINYGGFGRFLNTFRRDISESELSNLMKQLFRIICLREDKEQLEAMREEEQAAALPQVVSAKGARGMYEKRKTTKPCTPKLPNFFSEKLADNAAAVECYYATLHHCGFYIGRTLFAQEKNDPESSCYEGWKWKHLREAFIKLGFIAADSPKKGFAEYLATVFPCLEATNIQRGFNNRGGYVDLVANKRIIAAMVAEFADVAALIGVQVKK